MPAALDALAELSPLLVFLLLLAICLSVQAFVKALVQMIRALTSGLPWIGGVISGIVTQGEQAVTNVLGGWISSLEAHIATQFHNLAHLLQMAWDEQVRVAENLWNVVRNVTPIALVRGEINAIKSAIKGLEHLEKTVTRDIHKTLTKTVTVVESLPRSLTRRVGRLEHAIDTTIPREIKSARALAREAEDGVAALWDAVRGISTGLSVAAVTALVAAAIAALGDFSFLKCPEWANLNKRGCGLWGLLDDALSLMFDALILGSICEIIPLLETAFSEIAGPLIGTIAAAGAGLCNPGDAQAPQLAVPALSLPASPDDTLYLP